jgi:hypothetical protein
MNAGLVGTLEPCRCLSKSPADWDWPAIKADALSESAGSSVWRPFALPIKDEVGTPADIVHNTPDPAHSMHLRTSSVHAKRISLVAAMLAIINSCCN